MTPAVPPAEPEGHPQSGPDAAAKRRYLTVKELAAATGLSVSTLRRLQRKGRLPFFQPGGPGTRIVYPPDAIEQAADLDPGPRPSLPRDPTSSPRGGGPRRGPRPKWLGGAS